LFRRFSTSIAASRRRPRAVATEAPAMNRLSAPVRPVFSACSWPSSGRSVGLGRGADGRPCCRRPPARAHAGRQFLARLWQGHLAGLGGVSSWAPARGAGGSRRSWRWAPRACGTLRAEMFPGPTASTNACISGLDLRATHARTREAAADQPARSGVFSRSITSCSASSITGGLGDEGPHVRRGFARGLAQQNQLFPARLCRRVRRRGSPPSAGSSTPARPTGWGWMRSCSISAIGPTARGNIPTPPAAARAAGDRGGRQLFPPGPFPRCARHVAAAGSRRWERFAGLAREARRDPDRPPAAGLWRRRRVFSTGTPPIAPMPASGASSRAPRPRRCCSPTAFISSTCCANPLDRRMPASFVDPNPPERGRDAPLPDRGCWPTPEFRGIAAAARSGAAGARPGGGRNRPRGAFFVYGKDVTGPGHLAL